MSAADPDPEAATLEFDLVVAGLGPGGCAAALAARAEGLRTLAVEARGPEARRAQLVLVRAGAQAALRRLGLPDITEGRRTTTIGQVENRLRSALAAATRATHDAATPLALHWETAVTGVEVGAERVVVTLRDEASGHVRRVATRHLIDATGGRLEALGRPVRVRAGPKHLVMTAEYESPPWFDGIIGVSDPGTHDICMLFPTWGRRGVITYLDALPGCTADAAALEQRFETLAAALGLGRPMQPGVAIDVYQRVLARPSRDRVLPIGDAVGTVDVVLGAGMSTAIEDGVEAARAIAAAQRETSPRAEQARTLQVSRRIHARHRATARRGRLLLALRPLLELVWPRATLPAIGRDTPGPPPLLWPMVRFVFGRRPQPVPRGPT